jgi:hypothetical protein
VPPERRQRILDIADELEAQGMPATNSAVYARALGHRGDVTAVMQERRALRNSGVAVIEGETEEPEGEEMPEPTASEMQEDLQQLESAYAAWHASLEQLWAIEQDGPLSEQQFGLARWLEYQLTENLKQQERLRPLLEQARLTEAVRAAQ